MIKITINICVICFENYKINKMIKDFYSVHSLINESLTSWEKRLSNMSEDSISITRNRQYRNIKQIVGHMIDSVSNNIHRIVHLQYQESPLIFPNYATYGNNDKWIAIQNYENEDWENMVQLWKYLHLHYLHVIQNVNPDKIDCEWIADPSGATISLKEMIIDFKRHFELHLYEIKKLLK